MISTSIFPTVWSDATRLREASPLLPVGRLLDRSIASATESLVLLPPKRGNVSRFTTIVDDPDAYEEHLTQVQRLRGTVYLRDGAITRAQLAENDLHRTPEDEHAWHLLVVRHGTVRACLWCLQHDPGCSVDELRASRSAVGTAPHSRAVFRTAISALLARARHENVGFGEIGGWASEAEQRWRCDALLLVLAAFSLGQVLGGSLALATATERHASSRILRRLGGCDLWADGVKLDPYFDPAYGCRMELLAFDTRRPDHRFGPLVVKLASRLLTTPLISHNGPAPSRTSDHIHVRQSTPVRQWAIPQC